MSDTKIHHAHRPPPARHSHHAAPAHHTPASHAHRGHDSVHLSDEAHEHEHGHAHGHQAGHAPAHPAAHGKQKHNGGQQPSTSEGALQSHDAATSAVSSVKTLTRHDGHVLGAVGTALGQLHDHVKGVPVRGGPTADHGTDGFLKYAGPAGLASSAVGIGSAIHQLMHGKIQSGATGLASSSGGALASGADTVNAFKGGLAKIGGKAAALAGKSKILGKGAGALGKIGDSAGLLGKIGGVAGGAGALVDGGTTIAQGVKSHDKATIAAGAVKTAGGALMLGGVPLDGCGVGEAMQAAGGLMYAGASVWQSRHAIGHFFSSSAHDVGHWASSGWHHATHFASTAWHDTTSFLSSLNPF